MSTELKTLIVKLNPTSRQAFEKAAEFCVAQTHYSVEVEHLLLKLLDRSETDAQVILRHYEVSVPHLKEELTRAIDKFKRGNDRTPFMSPHILTLLREAWLISSLQFDGALIRTGAMLLALIDHDALRGGFVETLPSLLKIPRESLRQDLRDLVKHSTEAGTALKTDQPSMTTGDDATDSATVGVASPTPALDQYTVNLTEEARAGRIDPIEGRDTEIRQLIDILTRRRQNNPLLTGDAGVGKSAIVEGFALRIVQGDIPPALRNVSIRVLDLGLLQAGAGVKGEFENRLKSVINEVKASLQPIILFIDEAHTLIGAGGQTGQSDAANLLKPALARGELRTIAATTWAEYKAYFEKDKALTRRFQVIKVDEPSEAVAITMLRTTVVNLEKHHQVRILDEAVHEAVRLSHRYISERHLPDKAISVLDTACARVAMAQNSTPPVLEAALHRMARLQEELRLLQREQNTGLDHSQRLEELSHELTQLENIRTQLEERWQNELGVVRQLRELEDQLAQPASQSLNVDQTEPPETTIPTENSETEISTQADTELFRLRTELEQTKQQVAEIQATDAMIPTHVDGQMIASVISGWTGIPVGKMLTDEVVTVLILEDKMSKRIVGQSQALERIARRIQTYRANLDDPSRPMGVFLLVGPSGVGKTETAITLADILYGGEHNLITINMSEYQEAYTISSLKGSPPGYVGYGKGGVLTEAVRRNPYSVVLLDEIEKAHPDVMELFYQVFDKGTMEDGEGLVIDFKNTLIILTSNVGTEEIMQLHHPSSPPMTFQQLQEALRPELLRHFKAGFLGRLIVIPYHPLGDKEIREIIGLKMSKIQQRFWENHRAKLTYDDSLISAVVSRCTEVDSGARNVDHILTDSILPTLSFEILQRMAEGESFSAVHLSRDEEGYLCYDFDEEKTSEGEVEPQEPALSDSLPTHLDSLLEWLKST